MRSALIIISLSFFLNTLYSQNIRLQGIWTECFSYDSLTAFKCIKGFQTYYLNNNGDFISADSMICNSRKREITGRWQLSGDKLVICQEATECMQMSSPNTYRITWINSNLFYSTYISKIEAPGEKSFTVFKRLK